MRMECVSCVADVLRLCCCCCGRLCPTTTDGGGGEGWKRSMMHPPVLSSAIGHRISQPTRRPPSVRPPRWHATADATKGDGGGGGGGGGGSRRSREKDGEEKGTVGGRRRRRELCHKGFLSGRCVAVRALLAPLDIRRRPPVRRIMKCPIAPSFFLPQKVVWIEEAGGGGDGKSPTQKNVACAEEEDEAPTTIPLYPIFGCYIDARAPGGKRKGPELRRRIR